MIYLTLSLCILVFILILFIVKIQNKTGELENRIEDLENEIYKVPSFPTFYEKPKPNVIPDFKFTPPPPPLSQLPHPSIESKSLAYVSTNKEEDTSDNFDELESELLIQEKPEVKEEESKKKSEVDLPTPTPPIITSTKNENSEPIVTLHGTYNRSKQY